MKNRQTAVTTRKN